MNDRMTTAFLRNKRTHQVWLIIVLIWASFRAFAINKFFGDHEVNAWGYLIIDLTTSIPYAIYSTRTVVNFLDKSWIQFRRNFALTALFFYIPDIYVFAFARAVPKSLYIGFGISIVVFSIMGFMNLRKDVIKASK